MDYALDKIIVIKHSTKFSDQPRLKCFKMFDTTSEFNSQIRLN